MGVFFCNLEKIRFGTDVALQRHDDLFADGVDRRIRNLCEELLEIVIQHSRLVAEARQGGVIAHGADRIPELIDQGTQHELHRLQRIPECLHSR